MASCLECRNAAVWDEYGSPVMDCRLYPALDPRTKELYEEGADERELAESCLSYTAIEE